MFFFNFCYLVLLIKFDLAYAEFFAETTIKIETITKKNPCHLRTIIDYYLKFLYPVFALYLNIFK